MTQEVKERTTKKRFQNGSTKWNSLPQIKKEIILPIAAADVVEHAADTKSDEKSIMMENIIKKQDMVFEMPYLPSFFNDEPHIPSYGTQLKNPQNNRNVDTVGAVDLNPTLAYKRTLGEIIERYCQLYPRDGIKIVFNSYSNLSEEALDPYTLFPFENLKPNIRDEYFHWVTATELKTRRNVLIPSRSVYLYQDTYDPGLDSIRTTNGAAFGYTLKEAVFNGFCEILERDAFFMNYLTKSTPPRIKIDSTKDDKIKALINYFLRYNLEVHLFDISLEFQPHVVMAIIIDKSGIGPSIGIGTSCGINLNKTIVKTILEAQQIRLYSRRLKLQSDDDHSTNHFKDRCLNWHGMENIEKIDFFLNSDRYIQLNDVGKSKEQILKEFPHDIYVCDLSSPEMENYKTVKIIIPNCFPLYFNEDYMPVKLSRFKKSLDTREINNTPHPFI